MGVVLYGGMVGRFLAASFGMGTGFRLAWRVLEWLLLVVFAFAFCVLTYRFALDLHAPH